MALGVNQTYKNYYTIRLGTLTTQHQIQSNRVTLFTNEITDIASKINFFENQKVLTLATPDNSKLAIGAKYFDLPVGFNPADSETWHSTLANGNKDTNPYYTTPCQKQLFIYKKITKAEYDNDYKSLNATDYYFVGNRQEVNGEYFAKIPYSKDAGNNYDGGNNALITGGKPAAATMAADATAITDSRILSNRLMTGEFIFMYTNDQNEIQKVGYKDLTFITESQDKTAYQETVEELEAERTNINEMQKNVQQEMQTTEVQIQAIQSMMESTDKVLQKNSESFKWGA